MMRRVVRVMVRMASEAGGDGTVVAEHAPEGETRGADVAMKPEITRGSLAQRVRERERERDARRQQALNQSTEIAIVKRSISMCLRCSRAPPRAATDARANDCRRVSDAKETQDISGREREREAGTRATAGAAAAARHVFP